ncbi:MAG: cytochrome P460 family protein [Thermoanaerobaculum sp.]
MKKLTLLVAVLVLLVLPLMSGAGDPPKVAYPEGYRSWYHVKSMVLQAGHPLYEGFGGIHHVYANAKAKKGLETGRYEDGAVFVFDLLEAPSEGGAITEGARKVLAVMEKNSKAFAATGGWGFEGFAGGDKAKRVVTNAKEQCFTCHESQKARDFVFSSDRP